MGGEAGAAWGSGVKAIDLFAGAGGWSTGATQAGVEVVAAVNHWPRAVATHAANHPGAVHRCEDAALTDPRSLPAFGLLLASPACQGHTKARGKERAGHDAMRSTAWAVVHVADVARPRAILVENVAEMRRWSAYPHWRGALESFGYHIVEHILDAADYGTPQTRRRLIVTAHLGDPIRIASPLFPVHVPAESVIRWDEGRWRPWRELAERTQARIERCQARWGPRSLVRYNGAAKDGQSVRRPFGTLTTKPRFGIVDGDRMRMPSVAETSAAFGFPVDYVLTGTVAEQLHQLGNAVPVPLARVCVQAVLRAAA